MSDKVVIPSADSATTKDTLRKIPDPCAVVIFGASGDLTERKLMPALFRLFCEGLLPESFAVVAVARSEMDSESFRQKVRAGIETYSRISRINLINGLLLLKDWFTIELIMTTPRIIKPWANYWLK